MGSSGKKKTGSMSKIRMYAMLAVVSVAILWLLSSQRNGAMQTSYTVPEDLAIRLRTGQAVGADEVVAIRCGLATQSRQQLLPVPLCLPLWHSLQRVTLQKVAY